MRQQVTPNDVVLQLSQLARQLDTLVDQLEVADRDAVEKRHAASLAESRAFLAAEGSVERRKHQALEVSERARLDAEVADALVRHLRRQIDACRVRIDVGRTIGATLRSEMSLAGQDGTP